MDYYCSEDYLRFGMEYTLKIIDELKLNYTINKIDGSYIINISKSDFITRKWISHFFNYDEYHNLYDFVILHKNENEYHYQIKDFSNDNWRNYKKIIRKEKIKRIEW